MAFPSSPTNGQTATQNGITYTYTSATNSWARTLGSIANLTVSGNITSGNAILGNLVTANYFTGNGSLLTGITATTATTAATVTTNAQPNITSTGTLSALTVTGTIVATAGGVKVGNRQDPRGTNTVQLTSGSIVVTGNITAGGGGSGGGAPGGNGGAAQNATNNTGGGGGGMSSADQAGSTGGSGIVIIRYPDTYQAATTTGSPNVIYAASNIIYRFWQSGTITFP